MEAKAIKTDKYFDPIEIKKHLENVEYIIMAAPGPAQFKETPIHFTIFLNTDDNLSREIQKNIFDKFLLENKISNPIKIMSELMPVGFASSVQDTPMPILLVDPKDQRSIEHTIMLVMDFLADSTEFFEAKEHSLTGWSYSYN